MSPEQREGRVADVRSDVYAIGAILYELLTGRKVVGALAPPSRIRSGLNPAWDDIIIARCLAYEPGDRYTTAGELARAIEGTTFQGLGTCPPQAGNPAAPLSQPRKAGKQKKIIGAIAVSVAGLLAVVGLLNWLSGPDQKPVPPEQNTVTPANKDAFDALPAAVTPSPIKTMTAKKDAFDMLPDVVKPPTNTAIPSVLSLPPSPSVVSVAIGTTKNLQPVAGTHQTGELRTLDLGSGVKMEFAWIPPGKFMMGSPANEENRDNDEGPQHQVTISGGFWMGKTEVTQRHYEQLTGENPSRFKGADLPVESVNWNQAKAFCVKLQARLPAEMRGKTARLPTEAEWEYACRAGSKGAYAGELDKMGWYDQNSGNTTHPVGQKQPNAWGLYDMHGNVWEWCWDGKWAYTAEAVTDPEAAGASLGIRGGCWGGIGSDLER
jgi:formylglycine-generating enzyme required for sulfatase activity